MRIPRGKQLLLAVVAGAVFGGCTTTTDAEAEAEAVAEAGVEPIGSIHPETEELRQAVLRWRQMAPPEEKAEIDEIIGRKDVFIHVIARGLAGERSRGAASAPAREKLPRQLCAKHREVKGVPPEQNWDVIIDLGLAKDSGEEYGIANPIEALIHHEIMGHFRRALRNPSIVEAIRLSPKLEAEDERRATEEENRYRRHVGVPEIYLSPEPSSPR